MTTVERVAGDFIIEARLLAEAFTLPENDIKELMRNGAIASRCEAGVGEDAGRWRLTFRHGERVCRFVVDEAGAVLKRTTFPVKARPTEPAPDDGATGTTPSDEGIIE